MVEKTLTGFRDALIACRTLKTDISSTTIQTLLEVACHAEAHGAEPGYMGIPMSDLVKRLGLTAPAVSRNVALLAKYDYKASRSDGWDLVEILIDPLHRRHRMVRLTNKGRLFVDTVMRSFK